MNLRPIVNTEDIDLLISKDSQIDSIFKKYGSPPSWQRVAGFESLSKIILGQQVSLESAEAHFKKLKNHIGKFTPENILKLSDDELRNNFISRQKSIYLRELSKSVLSKEIDFEALKEMNEIEIKEKLTSIKGIGNWTAEIFMLFCLQSKDIFPIGDIAVINAVKELYNVTERNEIIRISESWIPHRSLATYFMWHYYLNKRGRTANF